MRLLAVNKGVNKALTNPVNKGIFAGISAPADGRHRKSRAVGEAC